MFLSGFFIFKLNDLSENTLIYPKYIMNFTYNCIPYNNFEKFHLAGKTVQLQMPDLPQV